MLAKVIAHADTRAQAARRLADALGRYELAGVGSNLGFLGDLLRAPAFAGALSTHYIERVFPQGWRPPGDPSEGAALAALACVLGERSPPDASPWLALGAWRVLGDAAPAGVLVLLEDAARTLHRLRVRALGPRWQIESIEPAADSRTVAARLDDGWLEIERDGRLERHRVVRTRDGAAAQIWLHGPQGIRSWTRIDRNAHALAGGAAARGDAGHTLRAPMPGLVTAVQVAVGEHVRSGDALVLVEAMKMVHTLAAGGDGVVAEVSCRVGDSVRGGDALVRLEPEETR
jgi:acetyl/propionyl-CoA carboxylase alpha subunit